MNKKLMVFLLLIVIGVGGYFIGTKYFIKVPSGIQTSSGGIPGGNSTGNLANSGFVTKYKEMIFGDINTIGQGLYKSDLKLKKPIRLTDDQALFVNADDLWIYYVNYSDKQRIYKVGHDGKNRKKLSKDQVEGLNLESGWLYYIDTSSKGVICKLSVDGKTRVVISKERMCTNLIVKNGFVYYALKTDIYKMNEDGSGVKKIATMRNTAYPDGIDWRGNFDVDNGLVYYPGENGDLFCITVDGKKDTSLAKGNVESMNVYNGYIYYNSTTSKTIYRIKLEGKVKIEYVIGGGDYYDINIVSDEGVMFKDKATVNGGVFMVFMNLNTGKQ